MLYCIWPDGKGYYEIKDRYYMLLGDDESLDDELREDYGFDLFSAEFDEIDMNTGKIVSTGTVDWDYVNGPEDGPMFIRVVWEDVDEQD